jgi:hypothetical protein
MRSRKILFAWATSLLLVIAPLLAHAQQSGVKTPTGTELGATVSHYRYEEPSLGVKLEGYKGGLDIAVVTKPSGVWFFRWEGRYEYGKTDYTGSGTKNGNPDWYFELRGMVGKDFEFGNYGLAPYTGLGFRYLYNDIRGVTSTGAIGYTRNSQYTYLPVGVTHRFKLEANTRLATTLEVDYLIQGRQTSTLSDFNPAFADVTNDQRTGYGIRGSIYYEKDRWMLGPWFQYWNTGRSDPAPVIASIAGVNFIVGTAFEPRNKTTEMGLRFGYRF